MLLAHQKALRKKPKPNQCIFLFLKQESFLTVLFLDRKSEGSFNFASTEKLFLQKDPAGLIKDLRKKMQRAVIQKGILLFELLTRHFINMYFVVEAFIKLFEASIIV